MRKNYTTYLTLFLVVSSIFITSSHAGFLKKLGKKAGGAIKKTGAGIGDVIQGTVAVPVTIVTGESTKDALKQAAGGVKDTVVGVGETVVYSTGAAGGAIIDLGKAIDKAADKLPAPTLSKTDNRVIEYVWDLHAYENREITARPITKEGTPTKNLSIYVVADYIELKYKEAGRVISPFNGKEVPRYEISYKEKKQ